MTHGHSIWFWLVWAVVLWYSTITIYVSVKGALDIKHMLANLKKNHRPEPTTSDERRMSHEV